MASNTQTFATGASINRTPLFTGENYAFWKIRMRIFVESIDKGICDAIENGPYIPMTFIDDKEVEKNFHNWTLDEQKRAQYDIKAKNILVSALTMDEFFRISQCSTAKAMWEVL